MEFWSCIIPTVLRFNVNSVWIHFVHLDCKPPRFSLTSCSFSYFVPFISIYRLFLFVARRQRFSGHDRAVDPAGPREERIGFRGVGPHGGVSVHLWIQTKSNTQLFHTVAVSPERQTSSSDTELFVPSSLTHTFLWWPTSKKDAMVMGYDIMITINI